MKTLLLIPTGFERDQLLPQLSLQKLNSSVAVELCGFGLAAAGILAARHIAAHQPDQVVLAGIAGSLSAELTVGEAYSFQQVAVYGIGAGEGSDFQTAGQLGWPHAAATQQTPTIGDVLQLTTRNPETRAAEMEPGDLSQESNAGVMGHSSGRLLLSVCAASASDQQAENRRRMFPQAAAEDMEGFSVAMACHFAGVGCYIIRGISNLAGDRNHRNWFVTQALNSVVPRLQEILK